jgi:hypothetical protein
MILSIAPRLVCSTWVAINANPFATENDPPDRFLLCKTSLTLAASRAAGARLSNSEQPQMRQLRQRRKFESAKKQTKTATERVTVLFG